MKNTGRLFLACMTSGLLMGPLPAAGAPLDPQLPPHVFSLPVEGDGLQVEVHPAYRARFLRIDPLELSGVNAKDVRWVEQRLRVDASAGVAGTAAIHLQVDVLDGVLWGENGSFGREPHVASGLGIASKTGNLAGWNVGLLPGGNPLDMDDYGPVLRPVAPLHVNYAYGEVLFPVGVLRIGRQPMADGASLATHDGRMGRNLWGVSSNHQSADRVLFGTKISELFRLLVEGDEYTPDTRLDRGVLLGLAYDVLVQDDIISAEDDLRGFAAQLSMKLDESDFLGPAIKDMELTGTVRSLWDERFRTSILAFPVRAGATLGPIDLRADMVIVDGSTRELAAGFAEFTSEEVEDQSLEAMAARVQARWSPGPMHFLAEYSYASGDEDPRVTTPQTSMSWARDSNLGLLLFEHALAFQSARSAAVGIENLRQLDADSFPLTEISTDGRVTNVHALFPQIFWDATPSLRLKSGVLFAWTDVPALDPIQTSIALDGDAIDDDAVNFHGGQPGTYWGTEVDLGLEWMFRDVFQVALEAALLLPGDALHDENGDAVPSWMLETRFTFAL